MGKIGHLLKTNLGIAPPDETGPFPPAGLRWGIFQDCLSIVCRGQN
jgi:hypothetical protein